jgi:hypothetical protein
MGMFLIAGPKKPDEEPEAESGEDKSAETHGDLTTPGAVDDVTDGSGDTNETAGSGDGSKGMPAGAAEGTDAGGGASGSERTGGEDTASVTKETERDVEDPDQVMKLLDDVKKPVDVPIDPFAEIKKNSSLLSPYEGDAGQHTDPFSLVFFAIAIGVIGIVTGLRTLFGRRLAT